MNAIIWPPLSSPGTTDNYAANEVIITGLSAADGRLDAHHAGLIEDLPGNRVRILTQETQNGKPARELAATRPNPMLNAHQEW